MSTHLREGARGPAVLLCLAIGGVIAASACAERSEATLGSQQPPPGPFVSPDASSEPEGGGKLTQYCPSDQCPSGYTTCPLSNFRCEVNLLTDRNNCGACGVKCPSDDSGALYECVDGTCAMTCKADMFVDNCDGIVDNGCETRLTTNDNCRTCGKKCSADAPCVDRGLFDYGCGCNAGDIYCRGKSPECLNPSSDDFNCGACDNVCDPLEGGAPPPFANTYYGCTKAKCGQVKCNPYWGDCDGITANGCEKKLDTKDSCGACGNACADGQECRWNVPLYGPPFLSCLCPPGQTFCSIGFEIDGIPAGKCYDLTSDTAACGACGNACPWDNRGNETGTMACVYGVCRAKCYDGRADCNGSEADSCEINTSSDPNNCGGCGIKCDAVAGQACVGGRCVVEPCDETDAGGGVAR